MKIKYNMTKEEIEKIAKKQNKSVDEVMADIEYSIKDMEYTSKEIELIIDKYQYKKFPSPITLNEYGKRDELNMKFMCYDNLDDLNKYEEDEIAVVTGFGPTSAPTAGTLSMIFRILEIQKSTNINIHVIISDLGALNSRQKPLRILLKNTYRFIYLLKKLGFDTKKGQIRTHNSYDHGRAFALISSVLKIEDLISNGEVTDTLYKRLNILGNDFSTMVDQTFTVADILLPILKEGKKKVITLAGLEEHYYPYLSNIVLSKMKEKKGGLEKFINEEASVGAIYGQLIQGLFPYVKMSKSIPDSSINLEDSVYELQQKILKRDSKVDPVVLQMIKLASNWTIDEINESIKIFNNKDKNYENWVEIKKKYLDFFLSIKSIWEETEDLEIENLREEVFY